MKWWTCSKKKKNEAEEKLLAQFEKNVKLKVKLEILKKENNELTLHLTQAEEENI